MRQDSEADNSWNFRSFKSNINIDIYQGTSSSAELYAQVHSNGLAQKLFFNLQLVAATLAGPPELAGLAVVR